MRESTSGNAAKILFNTGIHYVTLCMNRHRETQLQIHQALIDFKKGRLNPLLVKPDEFNAHLQSIQTVLGLHHKLSFT